MVTLRMIAASLAVAAGTLGFASAASAGHVVVGIGIGLPGIAIAAPAPMVVASPYYYAYGPAYYGPAYVGAGYGYGYYGRRYVRYPPRAYFRGYAAGYRRH